MTALDRRAHPEEIRKARDEVAKAQGWAAHAKTYRTGYVLTSAREPGQHTRAMPSEIELARRLWTVAEYQRMVETGILTREDHVELIHGEIIQMAPIGRRHFAAVAALHAIFVERLGRGVLVSSQGSLPVPPDSMPEPDVMVLKPRTDFYRETGVRPEDVLLLVEVAETSLRYDRLVKIPLYAAAGIREAWIVDVDGGCVEAYRHPTAEGYRRLERFARGTPFAPEAFPDLLITIPDILG